MLSSRGVFIFINTALLLQRKRITSLPIFWDLAHETRTHITLSLFKMSVSHRATFIACCSLDSFAQTIGPPNGEPIEIKGRIRDTTLNKDCPLAVIAVLQPDSTLLQFTRSRKDGSFSFRGLPAGGYRILVTTVVLGILPILRYQRRGRNRPGHPGPLPESGHAVGSSRHPEDRTTPY